LIEPEARILSLVVMSTVRVALCCSKKLEWQDKGNYAMASMRIWPEFSHRNKGRLPSIPSSSDISGESKIENQREAPPHSQSYVDSYLQAPYKQMGSVSTAAQSQKRSILTHQCSNSQAIKFALQNGL